MEKIIEKLESFVTKQMEDLQKHPVKTVIKIAIFAWIIKTIIKFIKNQQSWVKIIKIRKIQKILF